MGLFVGVTVLMGSAASTLRGPVISIAMMALVALLIACEMGDPSTGPRSVRGRRALHIAIVPLLMVCAVVVAERIAHTR